ncbi:hypothetical protein PC9H_005590 [Pleurotus ostreatus]|uniref:Uncharacterized protein n=1 Tax=Pleurotus ostreatus TaxID=5322 RepID=A0A8H7DUI2_PLEOS|nr:uncharacterized protein PC9H_005590 [Pleurotus ostreatus]KAF7433629.1 hypothetical protein PC9H_005590 [Pleurotus ostreatus]KAJ8697622.1 hypothetical protein PTI98_004408 [Pleurotus ostreatus]
MRFSTVFFAVSTFIGSVLAVEPGNDALHAGLSQELEVAIRNEYGPVAFDALASSGCSFFSCGLAVAAALPCLAGCVAAKNPLCIPTCMDMGKLCSCVNCLPNPITGFLHKNGICVDKFKADTFGKVYLGIANDTETQLVNEWGFDLAEFDEASLANNYA